MEIERFVMDYLENRVSYEVFVQPFDKEMFDYFEKKYDTAVKNGICSRKNSNENFKFHFEMLSRTKDILYRKAEMYDLVFKCMKAEGFAIKNQNKYGELYKKLLMYVPEYLFSDEATELFEKIFSEIPTNLSKAATARYVKERINSLFHLDASSTRPRWVQSSEWPVRNGQPLVFVGQNKTGELVVYEFIDTQTNEKVFIHQYY